MKQALAGLSVLNTRPLIQGQSLAVLIQEAGGKSLNCPTLTIEPCDFAWSPTLSSLQVIDKAIFISTNAVEFCFNHLAKLKIAWPSCKKNIAVGQATAKALSHYLDVLVHTPPIATSESLLTLPCLLENLKHQTILLIKGEGGRCLIQETLKQRGAKVIPIIVYKRSLPKPDPVFLNSLWQEKQVDIILITSEQSMHHLFLMFGEEKRTWLCTVPWLVISKRLATHAEKFGVKTIYLTEPDAIFETLCHLNKGLKHGKTE